MQITRIVLIKILELFKSDFIASGEAINNHNIKHILIPFCTTVQYFYRGAGKIVRPILFFVQNAREKNRRRVQI